MAIFYFCNHLPAFNKPVITIGAFDGIHNGHKKILREVVRIAASLQGESVVITFYPHPRKLLFPEHPLKMLTPLGEKLKLIQELGIDHIVVVPFTHAFAALSATEYVRDFLVKYFRPTCIVTGYDHHFGHDRKGNMTLLRQLESSFGFHTEEIPAQLIAEAAVSSSKIRNALSDGDVTTAAMMTGRYYRVSGTVVRGQQLGTTIGFPTANIQPAYSDQLIPGRGVYAVRVVIAGNIYGGMLNIGFRPTVSTDQPVTTIEAHIFDFNDNIYGCLITISFIQKIREERRFPSIEELVVQLKQDQEEAVRILQAAT